MCYNLVHMPLTKEEILEIRRMIEANNSHLFERFDKLQGQFSVLDNRLSRFERELHRTIRKEMNESNSEQLELIYKHLSPRNEISESLNYELGGLRRELLPLMRQLYEAENKVTERNYRFDKIRGTEDTLS